MNEEKIEIKEVLIDSGNIQKRIFKVRDVYVMMDSDLAELYRVEVKVLNQAVKRNIERFPEAFRFQLTKEEYKTFLRSQNVTLKKGKGKHRKYLPYVFTEQGVAMLSAVLKSEIAVKVSVQIIQAFVEMKRFIANNATLFQRIEKIELKQLKTDEKIEQIFKALEDKTLKPKQGIFYNGQVFDAFLLITDIIKSAGKSIILIDNYVDESVLAILDKRNKNCEAVIYTKNIDKHLKLALAKHNEQYPEIKIKKLTTAHDRFIIIDNKTVYHFGASLKDAGKKWFAFSKLDMDAKDIIEKL